MNEKLKKIGLNSAKVKKGSQKLTPQQAENLLILDLENALAGARRILGPSATNMSVPALGVLTEMVFNLGTTGVLKFDSFLKYFKIKKFKRAASEMLRSRWAKQVGERARNLAEILKKLGT